MRLTDGSLRLTVMNSVIGLCAECCAFSVSVTRPFCTQVIKFTELRLTLLCIAIGLNPLGLIALSNPHSL